MDCTYCNHKHDGCGEIIYRHDAGSGTYVKVPNKNCKLDKENAELLKKIMEIKSGDK